MHNLPRPDRLRLTHLRLPVLLALVFGLLLVTGCAENPQSIFTEKSDFAHTTTGLFSYIALWGIAVGVIVEGLLVFTIFRYRRKPTDGLPPQIHGSMRLEFAWTAIPALILIVFIAPPTISTIFATQPENRAEVPAGDVDVRVIGHQFWWEFQYPQYGVITANEPHFPLGIESNMTMHSDDVIHSFWIPALGGHRDVNPSFDTYLRWTPNQVGQFPGQCAELCGYSHANMRIRAFVESPADFNTWLQQQSQPAATPTDGPAAQGAQLFQQRGCSGCHTIEGTPAQAKVGPNLTHFASRTTLAAGVLENTPDNVKTWLSDPPAVKPGSIMPNLHLASGDIDNLVAYLESLK